VLNAAVVHRWKLRHFGDPLQGEWRLSFTARRRNFHALFSKFPGKADPMLEAIPGHSTFFAGAQPCMIKAGPRE
jgi:hypothetical protein